MPEIPAALVDPRFTMPPVPEGGPAAGIRWLQRTVARFANGAAHRRRRQLVADLLARVDAAALREPAATRTRAALDDARVTTRIPVEVLAAALGMPPVPAHHVVAIAAAYQPGTGDEEQADRAVAHLVALLGGVPDEVTAAGIGLLVQACTATADLIGNAVSRTGHAADRIVAETLLSDPPVRATRRLDTGTGTVVTVDLAAHGLPFGAGPHECPGRDHARRSVPRCRRPRHSATR